MTIPDDSLGYFADDQVLYAEGFDQLGPADVAFPFGTVAVYDADPGNSGFGYRSPLGANIVFEPSSTSGNDQVLRLTAENVGGRHRHAGVQWLLPNTYFQAELRVRCAVDPDQVTSGVVIFWPWDDPARYPPAENPEGPNPRGGEIDWWETFGNRDTRQPTQSFVHKLRLGSEPPFEHATDDELVVTLDHPEAQSDWHKIVCSWSPAGLWIEVDNGPRRIITTDVNNIAAWPMVLTCQIDAWSDTPPSTPIEMDIDYIVFREWVPLYPFPRGDLDVQVEAAFGADRTASPLDWDWTDLTDRVRRQTFTARRGRPSEAAQVTPGTVTGELENLDGALTMGNPASPWFPHVERGTPIRYWVDGAGPALVIPGIDGATCSTPDHPDFDFVGGFDIRAKIDPDLWAGPSSDPAAHQTIVRKGGSVGDRSFRCILDQAGRPELQPSTDGDAFTSVSSSLATEGRVASLRPRWVAWVYDPVNASSAGSVRSYTWPGDTDPPDDIAEWTLVTASGDSLALGPVFTSTADLEIGTDNGARSFRGVVEAVEIRDSSGAIVADPDWTTAAPSDTLVTDSFGKQWATAGGAEISGRRIRWSGNIDDLDVSWPLGDNQAGANGTDQTPSECWTKITAGGPLRFLQAGDAPTDSPIYRRTVSNNLAAAFLWGYWPLETGDQAARAPSGIEGDTAMTLAGFTGTDTTLLGSRPLPSVSGGEACSWSAPVRDLSGLFFDSWAATFVFRAVSPDATYRRIMAVETDGTAARWEILFNDTGFRVRAVDGSEVELFQLDESSPDPNYSGWYVCYLRVNQAGSNTAWQFDAVPFQEVTAATSDTAGTFPGTVGPPTLVGTSTTVATGASLSVGHIVIHDRYGFGWDLGWLDDAANAYIGETAAARFARLCEEDGVAVEVIGDDLSDPAGDLTLSEVMGPQQPGTLIDLLRQVVDLDGGYLIERPSSAGLIYRTRLDVETQTTPALALAGDAEGYRPGLGFTNDDARYRNQWTVSATNGGAATASDPAAIQARGPVSDSVEVNSIGGVNVGIAGITRPEVVPLVDTALDSIAARRLAASTVVAPRVRRVQTEMAIAPHLLPRWHQLAPGDRVALDGLPAQWTDGPVNLIAEGFTEHWSPDSFATSLACAPEAAYLTPFDYPSPSGTVTLVGGTDSLTDALAAAAPRDRVVFSGDHTNEGKIPVPAGVYLVGSSEATSKVEQLVTVGDVDSLWMRRFRIERHTPVDANDYYGFEAGTGVLSNFLISDLTITGHGLNVGLNLSPRYRHTRGVIHNVEVYEIENRPFWLNCDHLRTWGLVGHDIYRTVDLPFFDVDAVNFAGSGQHHSGFWFYNMRTADSISEDSPGKANPDGPLGTARAPHVDGFQHFRQTLSVAAGGAEWISDGCVIEDGVLDLRDGGDQAMIFESNSSSGGYLITDLTIRRVLMSGTDGQLISMRGVDGYRIERCTFWITEQSPPTFRGIYFAAGGDGGAPGNPNGVLRGNYCYAAAGQSITDGTAPGDLDEENSIEQTGQPRHADRFVNPVIQRPTETQLAEWFAEPAPDPDPDPTPLLVVGSDDVANAGGGLQTLTNPIQGTGNTILYGVAAPGPGEEPLDAGYVFPPGAVELRDYPGASFVPRVRLAAGPEPGTPTVDLGWDSAADTQSCFLVAFDGVASEIVASAVAVDVATNSAYLSIATEADDQVVTVAVQQQNDEMTAGPTPVGTGPGEYTELIQTTDDVTVRGLAVHHAPAVGSSESPGPATWDSASAAKVRVTVGLRGSGGTGPVFAPLPASEWTVYMDADEPDSYNENRPDGQFIIAGNVLQQGATASTQTGPGYGFGWGAVAPNEIHSTFPTEAPDNDTLRFGVRPAPPGLLNTTGAMVAKHVFRDDSGYVFQAGAENTSTAYPGTDRLRFDGTRTQNALIPTSAADPKAIRATYGGAGGDRVFQSALINIQPWMLSTELAAAGGAVHANGGAQSPWTQFLGQGQLRIITRDMPSQPWDPAPAASNPWVGTDRHIEPMTTSDLGDWWATIYDYRIDPIDGHLHIYLNKAGTGWVQIVNENDGWGLSYADSNPDQSLWHAFLVHSYWFHNATPPPTNNWAATDIVDGSVLGNNRDMWHRFAGVIVNPGAITVARLQSHGSYFLGG